MSQLMTATGIVGLPIISAETGAEIGYIRELVYDPYEATLITFTVSDTGFFRKKTKNVLPIENVSAIGRDAVIVDNKDSLVMRDKKDTSLKKQLKSNVIGASVVTTEGVLLGRVVDLILTVGGSGFIVGYRIYTRDERSSYIPIPSQISVSGSNLVVPANLQEFIRDDLVGLGAAVNEFRNRIGL